MGAQEGGARKRGGETDRPGQRWCYGYEAWRGNIATCPHPHARSRYDYEECASADADKMVAHLRDVIAKSKAGDKIGEFTLATADDFEYTDPIDGSKASKQGLRFVFTGERRRRGEGSAGRVCFLSLRGGTVRAPSLYGWLAPGGFLLPSDVPTRPNATESPLHPTRCATLTHTDGSRIIFRLSGTGSSGATIRMYIEQYTADPAKLMLDAQVALGPIIQVGRCFGGQVRGG